MSVNIDSLFADEYKEIVLEVNKATENIKEYIKNNNHNTKEGLIRVLTDAKDVCDFWVGRTYVGQVKREDIKHGFQDFYSMLIKMLLLCKTNKNQCENNVANALLYQGKVYRYLGHGVPSCCRDKTIEPEYDGIYVSWSKESKINYIESKLYGKMTYLEAEIKSPYFGIDLENFGSSRSFEREVVFPTLKDCVTNIKYIR